MNIEIQSIIIFFFFATIFIILLRTLWIIGYKFLEKFIEKQMCDFESEKMKLCGLNARVEELKSEAIQLNDNHEREELKVNQFPNFKNKPRLNNYVKFLIKFANINIRR